MNSQERLDKIENLILSTAGSIRMNLGIHPEVQAIENLLGDILDQVLELKKELGCTSTLSIAEERTN